MGVFIGYRPLYGHIPLLARAVAGGAEATGLEAELYQVPETLLPHVIEKMGAKAFQEEFAQVPVIDRKRLAEADAIIFGKIGPEESLTFSWFKYDSAAFPHARAGGKTSHDEDRGGAAMKWRSHLVSCSEEGARIHAYRRPTRMFNRVCLSQGFEQLSLCLPRPIFIPGSGGRAPGTGVWEGMMI